LVTRRNFCDFVPTPVTYLTVRGSDCPEGTAPSLGYNSGQTIFGARSGKREIFKHIIKAKETVEALPMTLNREISFGSSESLLLEISTLTWWSGRKTYFIECCQQLSEEHRRLVEYTVQAEMSGIESEFRL
jgi:hypothetical protein